MTVLLSTATQPALARQEQFDPQKTIQGLNDAHELSRVARTSKHRMRWIGTCSTCAYARRPAVRRASLGMTSPPNLQRTKASWQSSTPVTPRRYTHCCPKDTLRLSALICGAHRARVIDASKGRLPAGEPTRVVSTQLVEAGVDLDSRVVSRALAGLDSIALAAERCNREGHLPALGEVGVFVPPDAAPFPHFPCKYPLTPLVWG